MIGRLSGRIVEDASDGMLVLEVGGVGYEVAVPLGSIGRLAPDAAGSVTVFVHTHVREDALLLYGFSTRDDRAAFRALIGVSNIGPKIALSILGVMTAAELAATIARGDVKKLFAIPGVGKKTAERILLELKDKLSVSTPTASAPQHAAPRATPEGKGELLFGALTRMGYRGAEAERAVGVLGDRVESTPLPDLVRDALALLAR